MVTMGDVFAVVAAFFGLFITGWATLMAVGLLFPLGAERARFAVDGSPRKTFLVGLGMLLLPGLLASALLQAPQPSGKLIGWLLLVGLLALVAIGGAGISLKVSSRIRELDPGLAAFPALVKASAILIGGSMLPVLGWFAFAPTLLVASLGAGTRAVLRRAQRPLPIELA